MNTVRSRLKRVIEDTDTPAGKYFDVTVQGLIIFSIITFSIETLPDLSEFHRRILHRIETICVIAFTVEYLIRTYVATPRRLYVFSFFGMIDLIAILPFYLSTGLDLRIVRSFRLIRLVRILKLSRYNAAIRRFHRAFLIAKEEIFLFLGSTAIVLFLSAAGIHYFENDAQPEAFGSIFHSLWWAVTTLTTVGYGDVYPVTLGGRLFTALMLFVGLGIVSVPAGIVASALKQARELQDDTDNTTGS